MSDDYQKPDYIEEVDGGVVITLAAPATINGQSVQTLSMREPCGRDLKAAQNAKGTDADKEFRLFANLLECTPADVEELTLRNLRRVQEAFKFFRGSDQSE
ncbi:phage tail assembly protein [Dyella sp. M7H15-1]|uniref:phage tail assembly protein n=1 Tax=Dyella sp. M7H15-1 TaxID=2501295 RepID=UPI0013E8AF23|nr:phage tail assembly protein [Dyella sp. M7H15-1]